MRSLFRGNKSMEEFLRDYAIDDQGQAWMVAGSSQDWWLYENHFQYRTDPSPGVYLEIGANDPIHASNTFIYDYCLNWKGVCVEPNPTHHTNINAHRGCTLVPTCLSSKKNVVEFMYSFEANAIGVLGHGMFDGITETNPAVAMMTHRRFRHSVKRQRMECLTLNDLLEQQGIYHVDFVSLDVEGHELQVLQGLDFSRFTIDIFVVERNSDTASKLLLDEGYTVLLANETNCGMDDMFIRRGVQWGFATVRKEMKPCSCADGSVIKRLDPSLQTGGQDTAKDTQNNAKKKKKPRK